MTAATTMAALQKVTGIALALLLLPMVARAQMTIQGRVTSATGAPVQGASVAISEVGISTRTNVEGYYNFLIRAAQIRGQTVAIVARHGRFGSQSVQIQLTGGSLVQDFALTSGDRPRAADVPRPEVPLPGTAGVEPLAAPRTRHATAFEVSAGPTDLASAMAGKHPGLNVTSATGAGGSALMVFRGPRSFAGNIQPLVVIDGVPVDNQPFATESQRFGQGGFDYGTALHDVALDDIATYEMLDPATATVFYGGRAANGVLKITTKSGSEITGFHVSVQQRFTIESAARLPRYQNSYGQGLGGAFEFFDGQGSGVNDAIDQSWGPKLDGSPIAQASYTEARRPDVRHWLPRPDGVRDYFERGRTIDASVALLGSRESSHLRVALNARNTGGLTPNHSSHRLGLTLGGATQPTSRLVASANFQIIGSGSNHRPGTGFDEINPVAGFTRIGRQVDLDALRGRLRDEAGEPINWIYTNRNNPFFATSENSNDDERTHIIGGAVLTSTLTSWLNATLRAGTDDYRETRKVVIASGWRGGYPSTLGRGDFSGGGSDEHRVSAAERLVDLAFQTGTATIGGFSLASTLGGSTRSNEFETKAAVVDQPAFGTATATNMDLTGKHNVSSFYAMIAASRRDYATLTAGARLEQSSSLPRSYSAAYPAVSLAFDAARRVSMLRESLGLGVAEFHSSWWRTGNEITNRTLTQMYFASGTPTAPDSAVSGPERTEGVEFGTRLASTSARYRLDLTAYRERSTELLVATGASDGGVLSQSGKIFNSGLVTTLSAAPVRGEGVNWELAASHARNTSTVKALREGTVQTPLSPSLFNAGLAVRIGSPVGLIVGSRYLRDDGTGSLILRNGLPIADASDALTVFGSWQPDWTGSFQSRLRFAGAELFVLFDVRMGGKLLSATNLWGSHAGTLESTVAGREDSLLIAGMDSVTGGTNATKVSAEDYFHALAVIHEPWVFDASVTKLREARLSYERPTRFLPGFREHTLRVSLIGRNLLLWAKAPNIDPETALSSGVFQGFEMGQLPSVRSLGLQLSITP
jgi:hypothetical protein